MRGAPHSGFSALIRRISARRSAAILGRPPRKRDFQRQYRRKPPRCQRTRVSGRMIVMVFRTDGNHRYSWTKNKRSPFLRWTRPRDQLMSGARFYRRATDTTRDTSVRQLLLELAEAEVEHESLAHKLGQQILTPSALAKEDETARRMFLLQYVQPGLAGLMDGSVSTLAPLFAAAFATHNTWETFLVGLAASVGAGISMGFAEALSDDGSLTGRGTPLVRGAVCGVMTAIGGLGHTLPYLIPHFWTATGVSIVVVACELAAISWIRWRFMDTPFLSATFQVVVGGVLVFVAGILIGSS